MAHDFASQTCRDVKNVIYAGLESLAHARRRKSPTAAMTIVDGLVEEVQRLWEYGERMRAKAEDFAPKTKQNSDGTTEVIFAGDPNEYRKFTELAARYDEMAVNTQTKMLELAAKAANNEQMSIDRQMHIAAVNGRFLQAPGNGAANQASEEKARLLIDARNAFLRDAKDADYRTTTKADRGED